MAGGQGQSIDSGSEHGAAGICAYAHCAGTGRGVGASAFAIAFGDRPSSRTTVERCSYRECLHCWRNPHDALTRIARDVGNGRLLYPQARIKPQPHLAMPDVADRHADAKVTAKGLTVLGIVHARADHTELELTDAALHAEQQSVVRSTRIIDAVGIDGARRPVRRARAGDASRARCGRPARHQDIARHRPLRRTP